MLTIPAVARSVGGRSAISERPATGPAAAVAIVLAGSPETPAICFVQRTERPGDRWSGHVAFPGGFANAADRDLPDTAVREAHEELGLELAPEHHLGDLDPMPISRGPERDPGTLAIAVFYVGESLPPLIPDGHEIVEGFWVPAGHLLDPANATSVQTEGEDPTGRYRGIAFEGRVIWGLTYRVLQRFLDEVRP